MGSYIAEYVLGRIALKQENHNYSMLKRTVILFGAAVLGVENAIDGSRDHVSFSLVDGTICVID